MTASRLTVEMPERIAALPKDERGYPIPYIILYDNAGKPVFTANDALLLAKARRENRCHICGQELDNNPWFVGGPGSALLNGPIAVYIDGPMHHECMQFAMQVCPHLTQQMTRALYPTIKLKLVEQGIAVKDNTEIPGVPTIFMAVQGWAFKYSESNRRWLVNKPFKKTEYWQKGKLVDRVSGEKLARRAAAKLAQDYLKEMRGTK